MKRGYVPNRLDERRAYVGRFTLNGAPVTRAYLRHDEVMAGGELHVLMQETPNTALAKRPADRSYSASTG